MPKKNITDMIKRVMAEPHEVIPGTEDGQIFKSWYLGTYTNLDPCGKYHSFLYENGMSEKCTLFWQEIEESCVALGVTLETGEDPVDVYIVKEEEYFCLPSEIK